MYNNNSKITTEIKTKVLSVPAESAADAYDVVKHLPELEFRPTVEIDSLLSTLTTTVYKEIVEFWALVDDDVVSVVSSSFGVLESSDRTLKITNTGFVIDDDDWDAVNTGQACLQLSHISPDILTIAINDINTNNSKRFFVTETGIVYLPIEYKQQFLDQINLITKLGLSNIRSKQNLTKIG